MGSWKMKVLRKMGITEEDLAVKVSRLRRKNKYINLYSNCTGTTCFHFNGLDDKCFEPVIFRLENITVLSLFNNKISSLPKQLGTLPNLRNLFLSNNLLGTIPPDDWEWLDQNLIRKQLEILDISNNNLEKFPLGVTKLRCLKTLTMNQNLLTVLPHKFSGSLKVLNLADNRLSYLPMHMKYWCLSYLDISNNPLHKAADVNFYIEWFPTAPPLLPLFPSLMKLAAECIRLHRLHLIKAYSKLIPPILRNYLELKYCYMCQRICPDQSMYTLMPLYMRKLVVEVKQSLEVPVTFQYYYCSIACNLTIWRLASFM